MFKNPIHIVLGCALLLGLSPAAARTARLSKKAERQEAPKPRPTPYEKLFQDKQVTTRSGVLVSHLTDGKLYVEFPLDLLERGMLFSGSIERTSDPGEGVVGQGSDAGLPLVFTLADSVLSARMPIALPPLGPDGEAPAARNNISRSFHPGIVRNFKVLAATPDQKAVVVDMTDLFLKEDAFFKMLPGYTENGYYGMISRTHSVKETNCSIRDFRTSEESLSVSCDMAYLVDRIMFGVFKVADDAPLQTTINKTLRVLPEKTMRPRLADSRLAVTPIPVPLLGPKGGMRTEYLSTRWRIEPADEEAYARGELVEPKRPIVFYVDTLLPPQWKPYIRQGVEEWNKAFERIGFRNVLRAVDFPADTAFCASDGRHSTIRYGLSHQPYALSSTLTDFRTGEIVQASICLQEGLGELFHLTRAAQTAASDPTVRTARMSDETIGAMLRYTVMQRVGRCLGLAKNPGASLAYPVDSLRSASFTARYGLTPSVTENLVCNYVADAGDVARGAQLVQQGLGPYDYYAIKWLYRPIGTDSYLDERPQLDAWIAEAARDPYCRYQRQLPPQGRMDPTAANEDLGDDPVQRLARLKENLKQTVTHFAEWYREGDPGVSRRTQIYSNIYQLYNKQMILLTGYIGGILLNDIRSGETQAAYQPVPAEIQKRMLRTVIEEIGDLDWLTPPDTRMFPAGTTEFTQENCRSNAIRVLLDRVEKVAFCAEKSADAYTPQEYVDDLFECFFAKTRRGVSLTASEIAAQQSMLAQLVKSSGLEPAPKPPVKRAAANRLTLEEALQTFRTVNAQADPTEFMHELAYWPMEPSTNQTLANPLSGYYYDLLRRMERLLQQRVDASSGETRDHYRYMLYRIDRVFNPEND